MVAQGGSPARRRYERNVLVQLAAYVVVLLCSSWFVRHDGAEHFYLYFWSVVPALPVVGVVFRMGLYLREERDEYLRLMVMQSILVGTAALLVALVINDFLRAFAGSAALPPFIAFAVFMVGMGVAEAVQRMRNRVRDDDEPAA